MREGVDWALGVRGGVVTQEAARTERALMTWPGRMVGGTLTLSENRLEWKRSRLGFPTALPLLGPIVALAMNRGPDRLSLDVQEAAVAPAGRMLPWPLLIVLSLTWWGIGLLISVPVVLLTGWSRRCIAVHSTAGAETYCFAVRDVDGGLADLAAAGGKKAVLLPWRLSQIVPLAANQGDLSAKQSP
jgi:hypothetical protein